MISIDKAKQLKELGLQWNPKCGDWYKTDYWPTPTLLTADTTRMDNKEINSRFERINKDDNTVWLPRLDQLLDEIEKYNYVYSLIKVGGLGKYNMIIKLQGSGSSSQFYHSIREDAFADALIWILA